MTFNKPINTNPQTAYGLVITILTVLLYIQMKMEEKHENGISY